MIAAERWDEFVEDILLNHFDSAYADAAKRSGRDDRKRRVSHAPKHGGRKPMRASGRRAHSQARREARRRRSSWNGRPREEEVAA